jgi:hypothetical protein
MVTWLVCSLGCCPCGAGIYFYSGYPQKHFYDSHCRMFYDYFHPSNWLKVGLFEYNPYFKGKVLYSGALVYDMERMAYVIGKAYRTYQDNDCNYA